jgi:hypothetical protein
MAASAQVPPRATGAPGLDGGRGLAGLGALALLISLFLDWFGSPGSVDAVSGGEASDAAVSAWASFELIDILLAALALATLAWVIEGAMSPSNRSQIPSRFAAAAGPAALVLVLVSIIDEPPLFSAMEPDREIGAWIALAGAALMTIGALLRVARISLVVAPREHAADETARAGEPAASDPGYPETETRPLTHEPGLPPPPS